MFISNNRIEGDIWLDLNRCELFFISTRVQSDPNKNQCQIKNEKVKTTSRSPPPLRQSKVSAAINCVNCVRRSNRPTHGIHVKFIITYTHSSSFLRRCDFSCCVLDKHGPRSGRDFQRPVVCVYVETHTHTQHDWQQDTKPKEATH